jgi:hypothetical protein
MGIRSRTSMGLLTACAALAVVAQSAMAGVKYEGPAAGYDASALPTIRFGVSFKKKDGKKVPQNITRPESRGIPIVCPYGLGPDYDSFLSPGAAEGGPPKFHTFGGDVRIGKKGRFSEFMPFTTDPTSTTDGQWLQGTIPKHDPATGTIRIAFTEPPPDVYPGSDDDPDDAWGYCDSGEVSWTAERVG